MKARRIQFSVNRLTEFVQEIGPYATKIIICISPKNTSVIIIRPFENMAITLDEGDYVVLGGTEDDLIPHIPIMTIQKCESGIGHRQ